MKALFVICLCASIPLLVTGCQKENADPADTTDETAQILARVQDEVITVEDYQFAMQNRRVPDTEQARRTLLQELIQRKRQVIQARREGLAEDPAVRYQQDSVLIARLKDRLQEDLGELPLPTEEEVQAYYNANAEQFQVPARVRIAMLYAETAQPLEIAKAKVADLPEEARHFGELAIEFSEHQATRYRGGDLGYIVQGLDHNPLGNQDLTHAAFSLENPGQVSEILETPEGYYLLRLMEKSPNTQLPYSTAANQIRRKLISQSRTARQEAITKATQPNIPAEINEELLPTIQAPSPQSNRRQSNPRQFSINPDEEPAPENLTRSILQ